MVKQVSKKIGAVNLGEETDKKFLSGILPEGVFSELVHDGEDYWSIEVKRKKRYENNVDEEEEFNQIFDEIKKEFGSNLMEVNSVTSAGVHFVVYLKK